MDCSPPGSSVHRTLQARIRERFAISFSRGSSQTRDQTLISYVSYTLTGRFFATGKRASLNLLRVWTKEKIGKAGSHSGLLSFYSLWFSGQDWNYTTGFLGSSTCRQQLWDFSATIKSHKLILHNKSCFIYAYIHVHVQSLQMCPPLWNPVDFSPPGSSVHGILQARILEEVAMPSSRGSSQPRDPTRVSGITGGFFTAKPPGKPHIYTHTYIYIGYKYIYIYIHTPIHIGDTHIPYWFLFLWRTSSHTDGESVGWVIQMTWQDDWNQVCTALRPWWGPWTKL